MIRTENTELSAKIRNAALPLIAARIKLARQEAHVTHDAIAARMGNGATRQHLIKLEQGRHRPTAYTLERYAEATGKPAEWFVDPDPTPFQDAAA